MDHGLINRKPRIGIDDLVRLIDEGENCEEHDRLAAGNNHNFLGSDFNSAAAAYFLRNSLAQIRKSCGRAIMRPSGTEGVDRGVNDVGRSIEIRLADFEMDDVLALPLQRTRPVQNFEGGLRAQPRHAFRQTKFELGGLGHKAKRVIVLPPAELNHIGHFWFTKAIISSCSSQCKRGHRLATEQLPTTPDRGLSRRNLLRTSALGVAGVALAPTFSGQDTAAPKTVPVKPSELDEATISDLQSRMKSGELSAYALTRAYLARIDQIDKKGPALNSVIEVNPEALAIADALDKKKVPRGPLHGIPVLIKD